MVRDDNPRGAVLDCPDRVGRVEDALDHDRQVAQAAQPGQVVQSSDCRSGGRTGRGSVLHRQRSAGGPRPPRDRAGLARDSQQPQSRPSGRSRRSEPPPLGRRPPRMPRDPSGHTVGTSADPGRPRQPARSIGWRTWTGSRAGRSRRQPGPAPARHPDGPAPAGRPGRTRPAGRPPGRAGLCPAPPSRHRPGPAATGGAGRRPPRCHASSARPTSRPRSRRRRTG